MSTFARIIDNVAVEVWTDGGLGITPADVFVPGLASQLEPVPDGLVAGSQLVDGQWIAPPPTPEPEPAWPDVIAARRYDAEVGGIELSEMHIDTSRDSQALITGAALSAMRNAAYVCRWKTVAGFVDLGAERVLAVADAVRDHVQACFDREAELLAELEAGTLTAEMLETGWPA